MPTRTVEFLGRGFIVPGSYSAFRAKPQSGGISPDFNTQILIGEANNGWNALDTSLPMLKRVMEFTSFEEAKQVLVSGPLLDAIKAAFSPSRDSRFAGGPLLIRALNLAVNTRASASLDNTAASQYSAKYVTPGPRGNESRIRISAAGDSVEVGDSNGIQSATGLDAQDITITYSGDATTAELSFDGSNLTTTLTGQTDGTENLDIPVDSVPTLADLAVRINSMAGYNAVVDSSPDILTRNLDHVSGVDAKAGAVVKALLYRQAQALFNLGNVELEITGARKPLADTVGFVYLSGGASTAAQPTDYTDAIDMLEKVRGFFINLCSTNQGAGAYLTDFIIKSNGPEGADERFGGFGADRTDDFTTRCDNAKQINSEYMVYGLSPVTVRGADGITTKTYDGWLLAVIHNAIKASSNMRESALYKDLNIEDAPEIPGTGDIRRAIRSGGLVVDRKPNNGPFKITSDVTTYQATNQILNKASTTCTALALNKDLRESLQDAFLGEVPTDPDAFGTTLTDSDIRTFIELKFDQDYVRNFGWLTRNVYTGQPAWRRDFLIRRDGNAIYFEFPDGKLVTSLDYIFSLLNLDVVRGSAQS